MPVDGCAGNVEEVCDLLDGAFAGVVKLLGEVIWPGFSLGRLAFAPLACNESSGSEPGARATELVCHTPDWAVRERWRSRR